MRADFLDNIKYLNVTDANASLVLDDHLGICLLVCELHKTGLLLKYVLAPRHPINDFISSTHADRLAPVVPSLRTVRSAKANHSSYEYRLLNLTGDRSGSHAMTLSTARNIYLQEWENVHYVGEFLSVQMRPDLKAYAKKLVLDGVLSTEYFNQLTNRDYFEHFFDFSSQTHIEKCLSGSTTVDLASSIRAKEVLTDELFTSLPKSVCKALIFNHSLKSFDIGESPLKIPQFRNKVFKILLRSCFMSSEIWHKMLKIHRKPSCAAVLQLMSLGVSKSSIMSDNVEFSGS